jgi:hypothetical protein
MKRRSELKRGKPLKAKRRYKPVSARAYHDWIAKENDCLVCGGPACVHHVTGYADKPGRFSRDDWLVVPLCPGHHQAVYDKASDPQSVELLSHQGFFEKYGIDLLAEAMAFAESYQRVAA